MKYSALILTPLLAACAGQQSVSDAFVRAQEAKARVMIACAQASTTTKVQGCMLGVAATYGGGGNSDVVPVVQTPLQTILTSPVLVAGVNSGIGFLRDTKIAESQERTQIAIAGFNAQSQSEMFNAFTGVATAGFAANRDIASVGFSAAGAGFTALGSLGATAVNASAGTAAAITAMGPTYQVSGDMVGRDYVRDQSDTSGIRVQGNDNETARRVDCVSTAAPGGNTTATLIPTVSGTTNPVSTAYNALTAGSSGPATNNCGG